MRATDHNLPSCSSHVNQHLQELRKHRMIDETGHLLTRPGQPEWSVQRGEWTNLIDESGDFLTAARLGMESIEVSKLLPR